MVMVPIKGHIIHEMFEIIVFPVVVETTTQPVRSPVERIAIIVVRLDIPDPWFVGSCGWIITIVVIIEAVATCAQLKRTTN